MLSWKRNVEEIIERRRRFFTRRMQDSILVSLPVKLDIENEWLAFEKKWGTYPEDENRPFPSNEEIFDRCMVHYNERYGQVEDDGLPVMYSALDAGESIVGAIFGRPIRFIHRPRGPAVSKAEIVLPDYSRLSDLSFSFKNEWLRRVLSIQEYFESGAAGRFAQNPFLTLDALNFAVEMRGATQAYLDIYEYPDELKQVMEIGLDFNIRFQEAQMSIIRNQANGCFVWLGGWVPFPKAISLSVDAYVMCSVEHYVKFGFEYQRRLIEHFGHGLMHFHCNRADLATEVAKLPGLDLFQFGGDPKDPVPEIERLPEIQKAVGDVPIMAFCDLGEFKKRLATHKLPPNVWYVLEAQSEPYMSIDDANRLMDDIRVYRV